MSKASRKPRPSAPYWYWLNLDGCWFCKNKNNCNSCRVIASFKKNKQKKIEKERCKDDSYS